MKNIQRKGFTLIELLVVIVIIGILSTITTATFRTYMDDARLAKARVAAAQIQKLFLAENAAAGANVFTAWYGFDNAGDINQSNPRIIDKSEAGNDLTSAQGGGSYSQSSETGSGTGQSLRSDTRMVYRSGTVPGGAVDKLTMAGWFKLNALPSTQTYLFFLTSSTGFRINSDGSAFYYMNALSPGNRINIPAGTINTERWYYVVASYNGETDVQSLWLDGDLVGQESGVPQIIDFQGQGIYLGYPTSGEEFDGWLDEIMVFPFAFDGERLQ